MFDPSKLDNLNIVGLILDGDEVDHVRIQEWNKEHNCLYAVSIHTDEEYALFYMKKGARHTFQNAVVEFEDEGWYEVFHTSEDENPTEIGISFAGPYDFSVSASKTITVLQ